MPIRPDLRHLYRSVEWRELRRQVLERAGDKCEACGKPNRTTIFTYTWKTRDLRFASGWSFQMVWVPLGGGAWRDQFGEIIAEGCWPCRGLPRQVKAQLGVAHVDAAAGFLDPENVRAWCTWCHLHHDQAQHKLTRCRRKDAGRPLLQEAV